MIIKYIGFLFTLLWSYTFIRTQSLFRAQQKNINLNAGTPHDWEDLKRYQEEENKNE